MTSADRASLHEYLAEQVQAIDNVLDLWVPDDGVDPVSIHRAMRYSLFAGGKRVRPILAIASARAISDAADGVEHAAATLELVHTYSLIHDDLPALDNDDLRRGRPTCHKAFGEANAILAGDALQTYAYEVLANLKCPAEQRVRIIAEIAHDTGTIDGMIGGQVLDLESERKTATAEIL